MAKQNYYRTNKSNQKFGGGAGQDLGGLCPSGPNIEPPLLTCGRWFSRRL